MTYVRVLPRSEALCCRSDLTCLGRPCTKKQMYLAKLVVIKPFEQLQLLVLQQDSHGLAGEIVRLPASMLLYKNLLVKCRSTWVRSEGKEMSDFVIHLRRVRQVSGLNPCLLSVPIDNIIYYKQADSKFACQSFWRRNHTRAVVCRGFWLWHLLMCTRKAPYHVDKSILKTGA